MLKILLYLCLNLFKNIVLVYVKNIVMDIVHENAEEYN